MDASTLAVGTPGMTIDFDEFYRTHRGDAVRWAIALVGRGDIAEELAQDALLAVGRRLNNIDDPAAYLRRTVTNRCATWHRWHTRERHRLQRATAGDEHSYTPATTEMLDALNGLPFKQRAAVSLRYWADWTDEQIAAALGCAEPTVRVLIHRAIAQLRKEISE
jgi:RNA polymerase sigma factor (sigma-70 family)